MIKCVAAVVIGRNEGDRLAPSLRSVQGAGLSVVYVDSGSSDGSPTVARKVGIPVVELDPSRPFSAARGRNEGVQEMLKHWPDTDFVLFLDGDCVLDPAFPAAAVATFEDNPDCAIVTAATRPFGPDPTTITSSRPAATRPPYGRCRVRRAPRPDGAARPASAGDPRDRRRGHGARRHTPDRPTG